MMIGVVVVALAGILLVMMTVYEAELARLQSKLLAMRESESALKLERVRLKSALAARQEKEEDMTHEIDSVRRCYVCRESAGDGGKC
jgi:regulator of replication initiation timing